MKKAVLVISLGWILFGLGFVLYPKIDDIKHIIDQRRLFASAESSYTGVNQDDVDIPDDALCVLSIPKIELALSVREGTTDEVLEQGPGHYEETVLPGESGNCCLAGHRNIHGSPFRDLDKLEEDDEMILYTREGQYVYQVIETKIVEPTDLSVIEPTEETRLTLTTCIRQGKNLNRLIIVGQLTED